MNGFIGPVSYLLTLLIALVSSSAHAYERDDEVGYVDPSLYSSQSTETPEAPPSEERDRKFNLALDALGIPAEPAPAFDSYPTQYTVSKDELQSHLAAIDPDGGLSRYLDLNFMRLSLYRDFFSQLLPRSFLEYSYSFAPAGPSQDSDWLVERLKRIALRAQQPLFVAPLEGLKVVIDPGHMGTEDWDTATGKYVRFGGRKVSEGEIALSTSLLLANELELLGATVTLTRTKNGTVAKTTPETFDVTPYLRQYFYNSKDSWMRPLLSQPDATVIRSVKSAAETSRAYSDLQRGQFFIGGEDLEARSKIIDAVNPDIVIDIHFDANQANQLQSAENSVEAFVPGGVRKEETGSRIIRSYHLKHLLEVRRWNESVNLAGFMTGELSKSTGLPLMTLPEFLTSIKVKDGVYARNLYISRRNLRALTVYLECLHYDHVSEFYKLSNATQIGYYRGTSFRYPARLNAVVKGLRDGFLRYFREMKTF